MDRAPLNDEIMYGISRLIDDAQVDTREPSHAQLEEQFIRARLSNADPNKAGKTVGKAKRLRAVLGWAIDNDYELGEYLVYLVLQLVKGLGGFRVSSPNYVGLEAIRNLQESFKREGFHLSEDGEFSGIILEELDGVEAVDTLKAYARRARRGVGDAALVVGTSKDLMEAVAKYAIYRSRGVYPSQMNFPTLMGQAFMELGLAIPGQSITGERAICRMERSLYELACSINSLRNKEGTGHGRPFLPNVTEDEAKVAIESIGLIAEYLLAKL